MSVVYYYDNGERYQKFPKTYTEREYHDLQDTEMLRHLKDEFKYPSKYYHHDFDTDSDNILFQSKLQRYKKSIMYKWAYRHYSPKEVDDAFIPLDVISAEAAARPAHEAGKNPCYFIRECSISGNLKFRILISVNKLIDSFDAEVISFGDIDLDDKENKEFIFKE